MKMTEYEAQRAIECIGCRSLSWPCQCEIEERLAAGEKQCMACGEVPCMGQACVENYHATYALIVSRIEAKGIKT